MSKPPNRRSVQSYAYRNASDLPGQRPNMDAQGGKAQKAFTQNRDPYTARQLTDAGKTEAERRRENVMVKRQQPKPVLRPSPALAYGPDKAAFNQAWQNEQDRADQEAAHSSSETTRADRKAAFMQAHGNDTVHTRSKTRTHRR